MHTHRLTEKSFLGLRTGSLRVAMNPQVLLGREGDRGGETVRTLDHRPRVCREEKGGTVITGDSAQMPPSLGPLLPPFVLSSTRLSQLPELRTELCRLPTPTSPDQINMLKPNVPYVEMRPLGEE